MHYEGLTPNLGVADVDATVEFYQRHLGFELVQKTPEEGPTAWAMVGRDGAILMFEKHSSLGAGIPEIAERPTGGTLSLFVKMKGVKELHEKVSGALEGVSELSVTPYGATEFLMKDPNGYYLSFAEFADE